MQMQRLSSTTRIGCVCLHIGRQRIERRMEQFKECERESKTKAYSKEGLERGMPETPEQVSECLIYIHYISSVTIRIHMDVSTF